MDSDTNLTSGRLLARNTLLNLASEVAPFLVAVIAIPVVIRSVGVDRFGVLMLVMMVVGYFGIFDFGLGRAATKLIAEAVAAGEQSKVPGFFWTSFFLMFGFGICAAIIAAAVSPWLVGDVLKIPPGLRAESLHAFYLLALFLPVVISGGSLYGTLSAFQRFDLINAVRVPTGIFYYLGLLIVLPFSHRLEWLVGMIIAARLAYWIATFVLCFRVAPVLRHDMRLRRETVAPMLSFGGWVTVSAVIVPVLEYLDRFLIGAMLSIAAVAYYTVPWQVTTKMRVVPAALSSVTFAAFSAAFTQNPKRAALIFERANRYILLALFAPVLVITTLAPEGLTLWLGPSFAAHSSVVLRLLAIGMFVVCFTWIPYALIQAAHRPDLTAKVHAALVPPYVGLLLWMLPRYGIEGAAIVWLMRAAADAVLLHIMVWRLFPLAIPAVKQIAAFLSVALLVIALGAIPMDLRAKGLFIAVTLVLFAACCWKVLLGREEKEITRDYLRAACVFVVNAAR